MSKYLSCAETAKLVRQALKESFHGVKFGVKSKVYAGGASITVSWEDGPNTKQVDGVLDVFEGAYFDGMIDYKGSRYAKLDGEEVHFGADFIHTSRDNSDPIVRRIVERVANDYGISLPEDGAALYKQGRLYYVGGDNFRRLVNIVIAKQTDRLRINESTTLRRVQFAGDDGYGQGTVGRNDRGGDQAYKAMDEARQRRDESAQRALLEMAPLGGVQ